MHGDPSAWSTWFRGPFTIAAPPVNQEEPIDLSVKPQTSARSEPVQLSEAEFSIDVGVDEPVKSVPLDLTLDRQADVVTN